MQSNFNPRPPRGGRLNDYAELMAIASISIHAPREGGDRHNEADRPAAPNHFNPRPPRGGRRQGARRVRHRGDISIHAPREGGDGGLPAALHWLPKFQSTPPARGATPPDQLLRASRVHFNPRPPRGGRRYYWGFPKRSRHFNPRPPARGATWGAILEDGQKRHFNPRPPRGGRGLKCTRLARKSWSGGVAPLAGGVD